MAREKTIEVGGTAVTARQLTVEQVIDLFDNADPKRVVSMAELIMDSAIPIEAIIASTGLTIEQLNGGILADELRQVWEAVGEVNDFLSPLMARLKKVADRIPEPPSAGLSAD